MTDDTDATREFEQQNALKRLDHKHDADMRLLKNAWLRRRDAAQLTKDYGLFTLRSLILLNGGAILAMLALIGNLYGRAADPPLRITDFRGPLILFTFGLIATLFASFFGYFNFFFSQRHYASPAVMRSAAPKPSRQMKATSLAAVAFAVISLALFAVGVLSVVRVLTP
ncbi:MAG TPA: hypothetical protein VEK73_15870 [Xanthobacteraceae bacterium]|nr:hypothetical protein [Xanthobacteraceae bacterium]